MTDDDLDAVLAIEQACFSRPWSRSHFQSEILSERNCAVVAEQSGCLAGYLCLAVVLDEAEILDVAVAPALQRGGVGVRLLQWACDEAKRQCAAILRLEVRITSVPAITLYERFGFTRCGLRKAYYEEGIDAVLMEKMLIEEDAACSLRQ